MEKEITEVPRYAIFCGVYPGVALKGFFASTAWLEGKEEFEQVSGKSFGWYDFEDQRVYRTSKSNIRLMTLEEYKKYKPMFDEFYKNKSEWH